MQSLPDLDITSSHDGCRLATRDFGGSGSLSFILLHGAGRTLADWAQIGPQLTLYGRVIAADLRGHGRSGDRSWSLKAMLSDIDDVLNFYGAYEVVVVGHSLGGVIGTLYSSNRPRSIATVNIDGYCLKPKEYIGLSDENVRQYWSRIRTEHKWQRCIHDASYIEAQISEWREKYALSSDFAAEMVLRSLKPFSKEKFTQADSPTASDGAQWLYMDYFWDHSFFFMLAGMKKPYLLLRSSPAVHSELPHWQLELINALETGVDRQVGRLIDVSDVEVIRFDGDHLFHLNHGTAVANAIITFLGRHLSRGEAPFLLNRA